MGGLEVARAVLVVTSKASKQYLQGHPKQYDQCMS